MSLNKRNSQHLLCIYHMTNVIVWKVLASTCLVFTETFQIGHHNCLHYRDEKKCGNKIEQFAPNCRLKKWQTFYSNPITLEPKADYKTVITVLYPNLHLLVFHLTISHNHFYSFISRKSWTFFYSSFLHFPKKKTSIKIFPLYSKPILININ